MLDTSWILSWGASGIPKLSLLLILIPPSIIISPKLEKFNHTKLNKTFVRSASIRKQTTTISTVANPFIFYFFIISNVFRLFYGKISLKKTIKSSKQAHNAKKTESVKNRTVCNNLDTSNTYVTPKILKKLGQHGFFINLLKKESTQNHSSFKNGNYFCQRKSFCFSARSNALLPKSSQRPCLAQTLI